MPKLNDEQIVDSWHINAEPWINAVRNGQIESRTLVTDRAIIDAVLSYAPRSVLDIGCGEGWLARAIASENVDVVGIDLIPALVDAAQRAGGGDFRVMSYAEIAAGQLALTVDAVACNFSLLGKEAVDELFRSIPSLLNPQGKVIVQTLHPISACGTLPYVDGWREGSWAGFSTEFSNPAPWYFRTLGSWAALFVNNGLRLCEIREPPHPKTRVPASIIFVAEKIA
ncbi:MAG: class I SAM-dependent methyltransferase [Gammaproteobacteria bacterium]|nr:class I SAM-dependent methyltransferase [Gammaproteobacteria bacterium]